MPPPQLMLPRWPCCLPATSATAQKAEHPIHSVSYRHAASALTLVCVNPWRTEALRNDLRRSAATAGSTLTLVTQQPWAVTVGCAAVAVPAGQAFPEMDRAQARGWWRSTTVAKGSPMESRATFKFLVFWWHETACAVTCLVQKRLHVRSHIGICVFIDRKAR